MPHTASCGNATTPICSCGGCGGTQHGWSGAIQLIREPTERAAKGQAAEGAWAFIASRSRSGPSLRKAAAAIATAKSKILDWLATSLGNISPTVPDLETTLVEAVGETISKDVFDALCKALESGNDIKTRALYAQNHLFCSVLAEVACSLQEVRDNLDQAIKHITLSLLTYEIGMKETTNPDAVANAVANAAVKSIDRLIETTPVARHFDDLQRAVRILALLSCPSPARHPAVLRCALQPLGEPLVSKLIQDRLRIAIPDWDA
jgi:hypothetical protein